MKSLLTTVLLILTLGRAPAWAVLGQHESSVAADQKALQGEDRQESHTGYTLHQITAPNGVVVKEFVSPVGLVFGVSWQSPQLPNLQQLLGSSMADLQTALQAQPRRHGRGPMIVQTNNLVLVSGGHMRSFHGFAYVPGLMPANVTPEVLR